MLALLALSYLALIPLQGQMAAGEGPAGRLEPGHLYLQAGTIDTALLPDLLEEGITAFEAGRPHLLLLDGPIDAARRARLTAAGVELGDYLPLHSYIVRLDGIAPATLRSIPFVSRVILFRDEWKISPSIGRRRVPFATELRRRIDEQGSLALVVTLHRGVNVRAAARVLEDHGAAVRTVVEVGGHGQLEVVAPADAIPAFCRLPAVQFIEEAPEVTLRNSSSRWIVQSNVLNLTPLYDQGIHGEGQIVGVLDTRPDQSHCALDGGKILFYNSGPGADDHGTHVSCTAAGDGGSNNDTRGVAYLASLCTNDIPGFTEAEITGALGQHHAQGARLHNNSWGDDGTTEYNSLARGFDLFQHQNEESLACLAVTNMGDLRNPENAKNLLAVGATQDSPAQESHCSGGVGPTSDGRRKPEIYAPGCGTDSAAALTACGTTPMTGTSMASPAIAGTGALVRQYYTGGYYPSGDAVPADSFIPSGALIKGTLLNSAADMTDIAGYPSDLEGWGRVLVDDALYFDGDSRKLVVFADPRNAQGLSTGQQQEFGFVNAGAGQELRITACWTDAPGASGVSFAAVNDLDLEVVAPSGTLYRGNFFNGGFSVPGGTKDDRNNVEQVHIESPATGSWLVRIVAAAVNQGPQGFALVATGDLQLVAPITALICTESFSDVALEWTNGDSYDSIEVRRDGVLIATLAGDATGYLDATLPIGLYTYEVRGISGGASTLPVTCGVEIIERLMYAEDGDAFAGQGSFEIPALATISAPLEGFSAAIDFPGDLLDVAEVSIAGSATEAAGAEFIEIDFGESPDYITVEVILDYQGPFAGQTIPAGDGRILFVPVFSVVPTVTEGDTREIVFVDGLGPSAVSNFFLIYGEEMPAATMPGTITFHQQPFFIRGDCNSDDTVNIVDAVFLLFYLFAGGLPPSCFSSCDANDDGSLNLTDPISLLSYLFVPGSEPPPPPFPAQGPDPTPDSLPCE